MAVYFIIRIVNFELVFNCARYKVIKAVSWKSDQIKMINSLSIFSQRSFRRTFTFE